MQQRLRASLAGQLATAAVALMLMAALAACGSAAAPQSAAAPKAGRSAAAGSAHGPAASSSSSSGGPAATATGIAAILAEARRVQCPPDGAGVRELPGRYEPGEPIPAGFRPLAVVECVRIPVITPVTGGPIVEQRRVAVNDLGRLLAALRLPPTPRRGGLVPACLAPIANLPWLVLIGPHDQLVHPRIPTGLCGLPIVPVLVSLSALHWRTLGTTVVGSRLPTPERSLPVVTPQITGPNSGPPS